MALDLLIAAGFFALFLAVLVGPFKIKLIEHNLEVFLLVCGVTALTLSGFVALTDSSGNIITTGWRTEIIKEALIAPLKIVDFYGIPIGIVQIVLIVGLIIYRWHKPIHTAIGSMTDVLSTKTMAFLLIVILGLLSSMISAILAAIILVEIVTAMPLSRKSKIDLTIISCFSIGFGAALTPVGEPLSTIAISKLSVSPYNATFTYLIEKLGIYIIPGIIAYGIIGMFLIGKADKNDPNLKTEGYNETLRDVIMRALKVYVFIIALVFLGDGFKPIILDYITKIPAEALYWLNMSSAVLDNATMAAAEIGPTFTQLQINAALMGLLIAGGMLIPGNIPNIISAHKLGIRSKEWARLGVPLGFATMIIYFLIIFVPRYLGIA